MLEFNTYKSYCLVDVRTLDGNSKVDSKDFYLDCVDCVTSSIYIDAPRLGSEMRCAFLCFAQDEGGHWVSKQLRTSPVADVREENGILEIYTKNSIYILEPAELKLPELRDEADLLELFLNTAPPDWFCYGLYYDSNKQCHNLRSVLHSGMFLDSVLIVSNDNGGIISRYFLRNGIEFYRSLYDSYGYTIRVLVHNTSESPLRVRFFEETHVINPGEEWLFGPNRRNQVCWPESKVES